MEPHPIIVIEGPDAVGKTTWCDEYRRQTGARYMHLSLRNAMFRHQVASLMRAVHWAEACPVVIDRHWPSEQIYAGVYRGGSPIKKEAADLDRVMTILGVTYVVCLTGTSNDMFQNYVRSKQSRHEMYHADERYREIIHGYMDWWFGTSTCAYDIGYCGETPALEMARPMSAHLYDMRTMGVPRLELSRHVEHIHDLASSLRDISFRDARYADLVNSKQSILRECGYEE
jgi:thymidylate kinase